VQQHYSTGLMFGVQGTPAIITDTGELVPGYVSAAELSAHLGGKGS
jgi:thiol:disulfide interchange protein DsbC